MAELTVVLPECVEGARVRVQIHMEDGPEFEALVAGSEAREFENEFGPFRVADSVLPCGHEATVFARARKRNTPPEVVVVASS